MPLLQHILDRLRQIAVEEGFTEEQYKNYKEAMNKTSKPKKVRASKPVIQVIIADKKINVRNGSSKNGHTGTSRTKRASLNLASVFKNTLK